MSSQYFPGDMGGASPSVKMLSALDRRLSAAETALPDKQATIPPGTYAQGELGSVEVISNFGTNSAAAVAIPGSTIPVLVGTRPVQVTVSGTLTSAAVSTLGSVVIYEDTAVIGEMHWTSPVAGSYMAITKVMRRRPPPGLHAYQAYLASYFGNGTVSLYTVDPTNIGLQIIVEEI